MTYDCIVCGSHWTLGEPTLITSSGLCKSCLRKRMKPLVHKEQIKYSGIPCYATSNGWCDQGECKYSDTCLDTNIEEWEREVNIEKEGRY